MKDGAGIGAPGVAPYRVWIVLLTVAYVNDLLAHLARRGFVVIADDPPAIKGKSVAIFSCRLGLTERLVASRNEEIKAALEKEGAKDTAPKLGHQSEAIAVIIYQLLIDEKMLFHSVTVAVCQEAGWFSGNIDLNVVEAKKQSDRSKLS